jgi:hypothetical protein
MLMWTQDLTHHIIHERLHAGTNAQLRSCPQELTGFLEPGPRQLGFYYTVCKHLRHSVGEDTQLSRGICAALSGHPRRSVFAPAHRRLGTKGTSLSSGEQEHQRNCASKSVHLCRIVKSPALD